MSFALRAGGAALELARGRIRQQQIFIFRWWGHEELCLAHIDEVSEACPTYGGVARAERRPGGMGSDQAGEIKSKFEFTLIGIIFDLAMSPPEPLLISILQIGSAKQICRIGHRTDK